jgi:hypothetical protein
METPVSRLAVLVTALAGVLGMAAGGARLLAPSNAEQSAICTRASEWQAAAAQFHRLGAAVDPDSEDERGLFSMTQQFHRLAGIAVPDAGDGSGATLVTAMRDADEAGDRWVADGLEYVSLLNSGLSSSKQRAIALDEYHASRTAWDEAAYRAGSELAATCGLPPVLASTAGAGLG